MTDSERPEGQLFSRVYLEKGDPARDSQRMRRRFYEAFKAYTEEPDDIADMIHRNLGRLVPAHYGYEFHVWFEKCELRDLLDTITLVTIWLKRRNDSHRKKWLAEAEFIFREEHVAYTLDDAGGVHPLIDAEYQQRRSSTLLGLAAQRYTGVRDEYQKAQTQLSGASPDYKAALRHAFDAVESLFKLTLNNEADRLTAAFVKSKLKPVVERSLGSDDTAKRSGGKFLDGFCGWIDAAHFYRHGQGSEAPVQIPPGLAVGLLDNASIYLRWLVSVDQSGQK